MWWIKRKGMKKLLFIIMPVFFYVNAFSQRLTLPDAVNIALKNSLGVQIAKNNVDIATVNNNYGIAGGLPKVDATGLDQEQVTNITQQYSNPANNKSSTGVSSNSLAANLNASQLLFNAGRVQDTKKRLDVTESQSKQLFSSKELAVIYNVMLKYYDIIRQQSYAKTLQESIDVSQQKLDIVKTQQSVGMANNADLFQSEVDLNTQVQNYQAQQLVISQDKTDLLSLLTLNPDSAIVIEDSIAVDSTLKLDSILNTIASNPDIVAADQQIVIDQYISKETSAQRYPSIGLEGLYGFSRTQNSAGFSLLNQNFGPYLGVNVTVPIFNGGVYRTEERIADINTKNAALTKDTMVLGYSANVIKSWQAYQNNLQQLQTALRNDSLSLQLLDIVIKRFRLRQATIVDVKNAQQSFEDAEFSLINISYAAKVAEIQLRRYANRLRF